MLHCPLPRLGFIALASFTLSLACVTPALAVTHLFVTNLTGAQTGTTSTATGSGTLSFDDYTNQLDWNISFNGLEAAQTLAHFHGPAAPGANAGVQITLPLGSPLIGSAVLSDTQATQLLSELWYVNIHSSLYPNGETRGQLLLAAPIPEPETYAMMLSGLGLIGALVARRKRAGVSRG